MPNTTERHAAAGALATAWWQLMRAAEEPGISDEESEALIGQADAVLDRLAETPAAAGAELAAKILVWYRECHGGETITGLRLGASIVVDAKWLAGPELAGIISNPTKAERGGLLNEAWERDVAWAREHVLRPRGVTGTVPTVLNSAHAADNRDA